LTATSSVSPAGPVRGQDLVSRRRWPRVEKLCVFAASFLLFFLGMDRNSDIYDEGISLVGAMRVAAGEIPHRDFYANYGPGQFYTLAWLFDLFGRSILVERLYDLFIRAAIVAVVYAITRKRCRLWVALGSTAATWFWLFSAGRPTVGYALLPVILLSTLGSMILNRALTGPRLLSRSFVAGLLTGLVTLFRYDVGVALAIVHLASSWLIVLFRSSEMRDSRTGLRASLLYVLGAAMVFAPVAISYLAVAPIHFFLHDVVIFPSKYYARARSLPLPRIHFRSLENAALYLPIPAGLLALYASLVGAGTENDADRSGSDRRSLLILFGLSAIAFYFKGIVRISVGQMLAALIPMVIVIALLYERLTKNSSRLYPVARTMMILSLFTATWSALKEVRLLYMTHAAVLQEVMSPPGPLALRPDTDWCDFPNPLHTGLCFLAGFGLPKVNMYLQKHALPGERIFIGLDRHDRISQNDLVTYFTTNHLPATRWSHFDPDLQTRADIQQQMIEELDRQSVRYVVLESEFDALGEKSNDSSKSSGVTILDDYIRTNYHQVKDFGATTIWMRNGATGSP
jgi:hypothetical protein